MPTIETHVPAEFAFEYEGVTLYHTYRDNDYNGGYRWDVFTCCADEDDHESVFDLREFPEPESGVKLSDQPPFLDFSSNKHFGFETNKEWRESKPYADLKERWNEWHTKTQLLAVENHLRSIIDAGHLDKWRKEPEIRFPVRVSVTSRIDAEFEVFATSIEEAKKQLSEKNVSDFVAPLHFKTRDDIWEGDEIAFLGDDSSNDEIEVDMRADNKPFSWCCVDFVERIGRLTTPEDELFDPDLGNGERYNSVDEMLSDMSDERLFSEYHTFMQFIRDARSLLKTPRDNAEKTNEQH